MEGERLKLDRERAATEVERIGRAHALEERCLRPHNAQQDINPYNTMGELAEKKLRWRNARQ